MRLIKMLSLAAIAAAVAMAFVGVTSAAAITSLEEVVVCKVNEDPCSPENQVPSSTTGHSVQLGAGVLLGGIFGNITCTGSSVKGTTSSGLAIGLVTALTFSGCSHSGEGCSEVKAEHLPYLAQALLTSDHINYHVVATEHAEAAGPPQVHVVCPGVNCTFIAPAAGVLFELLLDEVNNDVVADVLQEVNRTGGFCPSTSVLHGKYLGKCLTEAGVAFSCWPKMEEAGKL